MGDADVNFPISPSLISLQGDAQSCFYNILTIKENHLCPHHISVQAENCGEKSAN